MGKQRTGIAACLVGAVIAIGVLTGGSGPAAGAADVDCSDFDTQAQAQRYYDKHGPGDPAGLDGDGDGVACETNPCPCAAPGAGGGGGGGHHGSGGGKGGGGHHGGNSSRARVLFVTDGDTIGIVRHKQTESVRLIGIDTPEVYFGTECGGKQASASMRRLLAPGDRVRLIRDRSQDNRDRYGRLLRYVQKGGADIGRTQIKRGWAKVYVFETPFARVGSYRRARSAARSGDRGVWKHCGGRFHHGG